MPWFEDGIKCMRLGGCTICTVRETRVLYGMARGVRRYRDSKCNEYHLERDPVCRSYGRVGFALQRLQMIHTFSHLLLCVAPRGDVLVLNVLGTSASTNETTSPSYADLFIKLSSSHRKHLAA